MNKKETYTSEDGFCFPFQPYDSQLNFMRALDAVLENGQIGIFESPTGTGKSLSIICGALKWLKNTQLQREAELSVIIKDCSEATLTSSTDDWISIFAEEKEKREKLTSAKEELEFLHKRNEYISGLRHARQANPQDLISNLNEKSKKSNFFSESMKSDGVMNFEPKKDSDLIDESDSDEDTLKSLSKNEEPEHEIVKIFYATRTHSQLFQFINEIKKSPYHSDVTVTTLGSRSNLCINDSVRKLKTHSMVNEKCAELLSNKSKKQESKSKGKSSICSCPYFNNKQISCLQENILAKACDVEDLLKLGKSYKACPYYATRNIVQKVELVLLPYNIILHEPTRESYGIKLKNNIVIVDEAHNLIEAVNSMYSAYVDGTCLLECLRQLNSYFTKYNKNFSPNSIRNIKQLSHILKMLLKFFSDLQKTVGNERKSEEESAMILSCYDLLCKTGLEQINIFEMINFCDKSHIGNKLYHIACCNSVKGESKSTNKTVNMSTKQFLEKISGGNSKDTSTVKNTNPDVAGTTCQPSSFLSFLEFLKTMTLPPECGKFICLTKEKIADSSLKFMHLNPAVHFKKIVSEARSVVLAGGTMSPISEFVNLLLVPAGARKERVVHHCFDHVVPPENITVLPVKHGDKNVLLDFTYGSRESNNIVDALDNALQMLAVTVPGGVVCFFPSYGYENFIYGSLIKKGCLKQIEAYKPVMREPKDTHKTEAVLMDYGRIIKEAKSSKTKLTGAILFSVVGGKMSEGINFSDDLCRCVVMVGLPYGKKDSELKEKISYYNRFYADDQDFYHIQCMKAVNQSIGRAIRHKMDYAVILLLDHRYASSSVRKYLPKWLCNRIVECSSFDMAVSEIKAFFEVSR